MEWSIFKAPKAIGTITVKIFYLKRAWCSAPYLEYKGPGPELFEAKVHKMKVPVQARLRPHSVVEEKGEFHRSQTRGRLRAGRAKEIQVPLKRW